MVVSLHDCNLSIEIFHVLWLQVPTQPGYPGYQLVVVALFTPLLDSLFICLTIQHERVQRSRHIAFVQLVDLLVAFMMWSIGPSHHVADRHIIVFGLDAQRLLKDDLSAVLLALPVPPCSG